MIDGKLPATPNPDVDLSSCEAEPIRIPGAIQPHGILLMLSANDMLIRHASVNIEDLLGVPPGAIIGYSLDGALGPEGETLADIVEACTDPRMPCYLKTIQLQTTRSGPQPFHAILHRSPQRLVLELEPAASDADLSLHGLHPLLSDFLTMLQSASRVQQLCDLTAGAIRTVTGFDRVMIYQFDDDWNGSVVAESRNSRLPSYLDHRFPASDIPSQARELYRLNRIRLIPDVHYKPAAIEPAFDQLTNEPLDLSYAILRSVSPIHVEYMKNMGTASSMSISILRDGRLWGLISCHHASPRHVGFEVRTACDLIGQVVSIQIGWVQRVEQAETRMALKASGALFVGLATEGGDLVEMLVRRAGDFCAITNSTGAAIIHKGACFPVGRAPGEKQVAALVEWIARVVRKDVYHTDSLSAVLREAGEYVESASGLIALTVSEAEGTYLLWFRPEQVGKVTWGGDPSKPAGPINEDGRIHPRKSFEAWTETVRGKARAWSEPEIDSAVEFRDTLLLFLRSGKLDEKPPSGATT